MTKPARDQITAAIKSQYGSTAQGAEALNPEQTATIAEEFGYSSEDLASIPDAANLGLSCGNPIDAAALQPGETVVDLGSGGGIDVFLAAKEVGSAGVAIGIDMTEEMIDLAKRNAIKMKAANAEFRLGEIHQMPVGDASVDCVISNCVINLCTDKQAVLDDVFRILKPGGRVAISDIVLTKSLPAPLKDSLDAYVGCIGGAVAARLYADMLSEAGFSDIVVANKNADLNIYGEVDGQAACCSSPAPSAATDTSQSCCGPSEPLASDVHEGLRDVLTNTDLNQYAASAIITATKPKAM